MYSRSLRLFLFIIITCAFVHVLDPATLLAQDRSTLRVVVISESDGTPITGANVLLMDDESDEAELIDAGVTDTDGFTELNRIDAGTYYLQISFVGHDTYREWVTLNEGEREIVRVYLDSDPEQFEEVVIESRRHVTTGEVGVRRIASADMDRVPTPGAGGDLSSYLQTLPGVVSGGDRGGELHIRGGTPSQNHILVDNIQVIKPFHISNLYSAFPSGMIQSADLYAGGYGAEYLGATSAVLNVTLRPGSMRNHSASASVSPYLMSLQYEGPTERDRQSIIFGGRFSTIEQTSSFVTGEESPFNFYDVTAKYTLMGNDLTCSVTGMRTHDRGQIDPARNLDLTWSNTLVGGRCFGFDESFNYPFDVTIGYMNYNNSEGTATSTERSSSISDIFFKLDHKEEIFGQPFDYGIGTKFRLYDTELSERFTDFRSFSSNSVILHGYVSLEFNPVTGVLIAPSLGSQLTLETEPSLEPRLRASYTWGDFNNKEISAAVGYYYQVMEGITDERDAGTVFTVWRPNEIGEPLQRALHGILGYQHRVGSFLFNLEGYAKRHNNILVSKWTPLARLEIETALADGITYGFDTRFEFERNSIYAYLGYGLSFVEYEAVSESLGAWVDEEIFRYQPAHDQRHKLNVAGSYELSGFKLNAGWEFGTGRPYTGVFGFDLALRIPEQNPMTDAGSARTLFSRPYDKRLPTYHRLDVSLSKSLSLFSGLNLETEIGAINLYDRNNIFYYDLNRLERVDQSPLMPYMSVQAKIN